MQNKINKNKEILQEEWANIEKDWFNVYNWQSLAHIGYSEDIAKLLLDDFKEVQMNYDGLRKGNFRQGNHQGQCQLSTNIFQLVEKRFCRAMFNSGEIPILGKSLDYEVPFKARREDRHGDIDLLSYKDNQLFIIEVKILGSSESIIKAILEAYVYSKLVYEVREVFFDNFGVSPSVTMRPVVLTFVNSTSGQQLLEIEKYPNVKALIEKINNNLSQVGIGNIKYLLITNTDEEIKSSLEVKDYDEKSKLIVFKDSFNLQLREIKL